MKEKISKKKKKIFAIISAVLIVIALIILFVILSISRYIDTHTWAAISVSGEINSSPTDAFAYEQEYLKGDNLSFGDVILNITDITTDGTVEFEVQQGDLLNANGESVNDGTLVKSGRADYKMNNGYVSLIVIDNRYQ